MPRSEENPELTIVTNNFYVCVTYLKFLGEWLQINIQNLTFLESGENYLHNGAEMVYVACTWMKWCQDEEEGKKLL